MRKFLPVTLNFTLVKIEETVPDCSVPEITHAADIGAEVTEFPPVILLLPSPEMMLGR